MLGGRRLREPIARYRPFVTSTKAELLAALDDFIGGRLAEVAPMHTSAADEVLYPPAVASAGNDH